MLLGNKSFKDNIGTICIIIATVLSIGGVAYASLSFTGNVYTDIANTKRDILELKDANTISKIDTKEILQKLEQINISINSIDKREELTNLELSHIKQDIADLKNKSK